MVTTPRRLPIGAIRSAWRRLERAAPGRWSLGGNGDDGRRDRDGEYGERWADRRTP
jgi:hypothetical protein